METQEELARAIGARIRAVRQKQGLTLEALAHTSDVHVTYLGEVERGKRNPSVYFVWRIAKALHQPAGKFFPD